MKNESYQYKFIMQHDEFSIRKLSDIQYSCFNGRIRILYYIACFVMIYFGIQLGGTAGITCILFACLLVTNINLPARRSADKMLKTFKGNFPTTEYRFFTDDFLYGDPNVHEDDMIPGNYGDIVKLVQDIDFFYLFINKYGAYMLPKNNLSKDEQQKFVKFIENKTELTFFRPGSFFNLRWRNVFKKYN